MTNSKLHVVASDHNGGTIQFDAFNRLEVANPFTEGDYTFNYDLLPEKFDSIATGTGSVSYDNNERRAVLSVPTVGDKIVFQTRKYHTYQAAKGGKIVLSLTPGIKTGIRRRWGYFDEKNGLFYENDGEGNFYCVQRSSTTGSVVDTKQDVTDLLQAIGIDCAKDNLFFLDFQWLGAGVTIFRTERESGGVFELHKFENPNANFAAYMQTGSLPIRYEIEALTSTSEADDEEMRVTCASVVSSGGTNPPEIQFEESNGAVLSLSTTSETPIFALRLAQTFNTFENRGIVFPNNIDISVSDGNTRFRVYINPVISGSTWSSVHSSSICEYSTNFTFTSAGRKILDRIIFSAAGTNNRAAILNRSDSGFLKNNLTRSADNTESDVIVITAQKIESGDTPKVSASLSWGEVR